MLMCAKPQGTFEFVHQAGVQHSMSAAPRRLLARTRFSDPYTCSACRRCRFLSTSASLQSGHNKWSTIKHDKGKNDAAKNKQRSIFSHEISTASKSTSPHF